MFSVCNNCLFKGIFVFVNYSLPQTSQLILRIEKKRLTIFINIKNKTYHSKRYLLTHKHTILGRGKTRVVFLVLF